MQTQNFTHDPIAGRYTHRTAKHVFVELSQGAWNVYCGLTVWHRADDLGEALLAAELVA